MGEDLNKFGKGTVIGLFHFGGKYTGGKLIKFQVVSNTFAALALPGTGLIGTWAFGFIDFNLAFHGFKLHYILLLKIGKQFLSN